MRRFSTLLTILLVLMGLVPLGGAASAHPVSVDGSGADWTSVGPAPTEKQEGHIVRNGSQKGQYAWRDAGGDNRTVPLETVPGETDLRQLRVTGTATTLYVYAQFASVTAVTGSRAAQLQLALRTDLSAIGSTSFVSPTVSTSLPTSNAWQYLIQTRFATGTALGNAPVSQAQPLIYTDASTFAAAGDGRFSKNDNSMELAIPWSALGSAGGPIGRVRISAAVLRSDGTAPTDASTSNVRDVVSPQATTLAELTDNTLDYAFDVYFDATGEVYSPILITEVTPLVLTGPASIDTRAQWFEVSNITGATLSAADVASFKVGDASNRDSSEGMFSLPSRSLTAGQSLVVARQRNNFQSLYPVGSFPSLNYGGGGNVYGLHNDGNAGGATNLLSAYTPTGWFANSSIEANGAFQLPIKPATGVTTYTDQLVLLDSQDTIADLVQYASPGVTDIYPGNTPLAAPAGTNGFTVDNDYQRCPNVRDTNNAPADFALTNIKLQQTPGAACAFSDLYVSVVGPSNVVARAVAPPSTQDFIVTYGNNRIDAPSATLVVTLPVSMSAGAIVSSPTLGAPTTTTVGSRERLTWNIATPIVTGASGVVTVTTTLPLGVAAPQSTSLDASITGTVTEPATEQPNNVATLPVAYVSQPTVDVGVTKTVADSSRFYPGGQIVYEVKASNGGTLQADSVKLTDTVPAGLTLSSNSLGQTPTTPALGQIQLDLGTLPANTLNRTVVLTFTVDPTIIVGSQVTNTVDISTSSTPESPTTNNSAMSKARTVGEVPPVADLTLAKAIDDSSKAYPGGQIVYRLTYANPGTLPTDDAKIVDTFPSSLTYVSNSADVGAVVSGNQVTFTLGALAVMQPATTILVTFNVRTDAPIGASFTNQATISTTAPETAMGNNTATSPAATVGPVADVALVKTVEDSTQRYPNGQLVYRLIYRNDGGLDATGVTIADTVPAGLTYVSNSRGLVADTSVAGQVKFTIGTVGMQSTGAPLLLTFSVNSNATVGSSVTNSATIATTAPELVISNNSSSAAAVTLDGRPAVDLVVTKQVTDASRARPNGTIVYTLGYRNDGTATAANVQLVDVLPAGLTYVSNSAGLAPDTFTAGQVKFTIGMLAGGTSGSIQITVKVTGAVGSSLINQATISTSSSETIIANNTASAAAVTVGSYQLFIPVVLTMP